MNGCFGREEEDDMNEFFCHLGGGDSSSEICSLTVLQAHRKGHDSRFN